MDGLMNLTVGDITFLRVMYYLGFITILIQSFLSLYIGFSYFQIPKFKYATALGILTITLLILRIINQICIHYLGVSNLGNLYFAFNIFEYLIGIINLFVFIGFLSNLKTISIKDNNV